MNRHDGEYAALIHKLAHRYAATLEPLILTDEDMTPHENKIRHELRAAGIQPGKQLELALADVTLAMLRAPSATPRHRCRARLLPPFQVGDEVEPRPLWTRARSRAVG